MHDLSPPSSPSISPSTSPKSASPTFSNTSPSFSGSSFSPISTKLLPSVPDSSAAVLSNSNFFCLLLGLDKEENPEIFYQKDCQDDICSLISFISKLKIPQNNSTTQFSTVSFQYSFDKTFFASFFFDIADYSSPSLHKRMVLVFGHQDRTILINAFTKHKKAFINFIQKIQYLSFIYLEAHKDNNSENATITNEILEYFHSKFPKLDDTELKQQATQSNDNTSISNFEKITHFSTILEPELTEMITNLPKSQFLSFIQMRANLRSEGTILRFGQFQTLPELMTFIQVSNPNSSVFRLLDLVDSGALFHCIFSVLAGRTLVIKSCDTNEALSLGKRFALFVPFFEEKLFAQMDNTTIENSLKYSIIIVKDFPPETGGAVSLLDLDNRMYKGESCPHKSFVWTTGQRATRSSESSFLVTCYREVKRVAGKLAIALNNNFDTKGELLKPITEAGLQKDDEPIFRYWVEFASNTLDSRPILPNNRSKFGVILTAI